jgi:LPS-assembly lipoprotein
MSARRFRRWALGVGMAALVGAIAGCGFHPLYAPGGATNAALGHVFVDVIPNRNGQLLRQALQLRLDGGDSEEKQLVLSVSYVEHYEGIGIESDNVSTRTRISATATWALKKPGLFGATVASGSARALDGANTIAGQFFYSDLSTEAIDRRMGQTIAEQIVQGIATYFETHAKPA